MDFHFLFCRKTAVYQNGGVTMYRVITVEWMKIKRNPVWLAFLFLPIIPAVIGTFNYLANLELLTSSWYSLWSQHTLFFCYFFMPALIGVYCSFLWKMEHFGHNWNQLMVSLSPEKIIAGKLFMASVMTVLTILWVFVLYICCGKFAGIKEKLPDELTEWILCGIAGGIAASSLQVFLSLVIRSFSVPVGIGLAGGIIGLMATSKGVWYLVPYSLLSLGMRANNPNMKIAFLPFFANAVFFTGLFFAGSVFYLKKFRV